MRRDGRARYRDDWASAALSVALFVVLIGVCKSAPLPTEEETAAKNKTATKNPGITYAAGPNQLTLIIGDKGAVRFGYETDNQFRAERRFANGTVVGYYGYIGADGVPIRVKYGAVDQLGFQSMQEIIPNEFPPETTTPAEEVEEGEGRTKLASDEDDDLPIGQIVDDEKNSVSVDSIDEIIRRKFVFPKIELEEFANVKGRQLRSLPEALPIEAPSTVDNLVMEQQPGEPAIIYSDPERRPTIIKTVRAHYSLN